MKKRIPKGYREPFQRIYETKGRDCSANGSLCGKCPIESHCGLSTPDEDEVLYEAVKPYFEEKV